MFRPGPPLSRLPVTSLDNHAAQRPRANELYTGIENNPGLTPKELRITYPATAQSRASSLLVPFAPTPLSYAALRKQAIARLTPQEKAAMNAMRDSYVSSPTEFQVRPAIPNDMKEYPLCLSLNHKSATECSFCHNTFTSGLGQTPTIKWDNDMPGRPDISRVILTKSNGTKIAIPEEICINVPSKSEKGIMHTCRVAGFRFSSSQDIPGPPKSIFVNRWKGIDWGTTRHELDSSYFNDINIVECPSITAGGKSRKSSRKNRSKSRKSRKNRRRH